MSMANENKDLSLQTTDSINHQGNWSASCYPEFAVICSYLKLFNRHCGGIPLRIESLDRGFLALHSGLGVNNEDVQYIVDLHIALLRAIGIKVTPQGNGWKKKVLNIAQEYDNEQKVLWELGKFDYDEFSIKSKILLTKLLCEAQFDKNLKLKAYIKPLLANDLRLQPIGKDRFGLLYWYQQDAECSIRLYTVEDDDDDSSSWKVLCSNYEQLCSTVEVLSDRIQSNPRESARKCIKKSRKRSLDEWESDANEPCAACLSCASPATILLCDSCNAGYHISCLRPPLFAIPDGDFYCPFCDEINLVKNLQNNVTKLLYQQRAFERATRRMKMHGLDHNNIIDHQEDDSTMRRSNRARKDINYNFQEFDDLIDNAIECSQTHKKANITKSATTNVEICDNKSHISSVSNNHRGRRNLIQRNDIIPDGKDKIVEEYDSFSNNASPELGSTSSTNQSDDIENEVTNDAVSDDCLITISPSVVKDVAIPIGEGVMPQDNEYDNILSIHSNNSTDADDAEVYTPTDSEWNSLSERYEASF